MCVSSVWSSYYVFSSNFFPHTLFSVNKTRKPENENHTYFKHANFVFMSCLSFLSPLNLILIENKKNKHKFRNYFLLRYRRTYAPPIPIHVYLSRQSSSDENLFCNKVKKNLQIKKKKTKHTKLKKKIERKKKKRWWPWFRSLYIFAVGEAYIHAVQIQKEKNTLYLRIRYDVSWSFWFCLNCQRRRRSHRVNWEFYYLLLSNVTKDLSLFWTNHLDADLEITKKINRLASTNRIWRHLFTRKEKEKKFLIWRRKGPVQWVWRSLVKSLIIHSHAPIPLSGLRTYRHIAAVTTTEGGAETGKILKEKGKNNLS